MDEHHGHTDITSVESGPINRNIESTPLVNSQPRSLWRRLIEWRFLSATIIILFYVLGICCIILGGIYVNDCPGQKYLPTLYITFGAINLFVCLLNTVLDYQTIFQGAQTERPDWLDFVTGLIAVIQTFLFIFIFGWTIDYYDTPDSEKKYCDYTFFMISFCGSILGMTLFILPALLLFFIYISLAILCGNSNVNVKVGF